MANDTGRDTELRIMTDMPENPLNAFRYPFRELKDEEYTHYQDNLIRDIPNHISADSGDFPDNISSTFWFKEGEREEEHWVLLCRLDNGNYALYDAWCDYTGFDCRGGMSLYVNSDYSVLINYAMGDRHYDEYISQTEQLLCG